MREKTGRFCTLFLPSVLPVTSPIALAAGSEEFCYGHGTEECAAPDDWPGVCVLNNEDRQSPLDINATTIADLPVWFANYEEKEEITVITNGHTLEVEIEEGEFDSFHIGDKSCKLLQYHFHTPAEHLIGGTSFPMEAHLVHECEGGGLLVVGVMMSYLDGEENPTLQAA